MQKIIDSVWYWSKIVWDFYTVSSWAVLIWNWHNFRAYIWVWTEGDENNDSEDIAAWWNAISKPLALAIFWDRHITYEWKEYWLALYYKL